MLWYTFAMRSKILVQFSEKEFTFFTEKEVFSPNQLDLGSRALLESIIDCQAKQVLDLGCGYGAMGIIYAHFNPESFVTLLDNDPRALELTKKNGPLNGVKNIKPFKADVTYATLPWQFDLILSNPPWAQNRSVIPKLLEFAYNHLVPGGKFAVVINRTFQLEKPLQKIFGNVTTLLDRPPYKVLQSVKI